MIARALKHFREQRGLSQQKLAVAADLSVSIVSQIEQGKRPDPRVHTAAKLARVLGVRIEDLLTEPPAPAAKKARG